ncbi:beta-lactamase [Erythrobacter sp. SG61-1L]|nr:beta-lactamase [Erythrobacter sp. SG61-1L]
MQPSPTLGCLSRRNLLRGGAALGLGAGLGGWPLSAFAATGEQWPALRAMARSYVESHKVANMLAYMGQGDGAPQMVAEGRDMAGGPRKSDADSLYRLYSMTKPITGMAVMILIDEGRLSLDQPLAEILPAFADVKVQKTYDGLVSEDNLEPLARPITIRHLLTHTAGLGYSIVQQGPIKALMEERGVISGQISRIPMEGFIRGKPVESLSLFAERLAEIPLVRQPGTRWSYSCGLDLLGRVIELASGETFDQFLKDHIFDPCGMTSTWFRVPASEAGRLTTTYAVVKGEVLPLDPGPSSIFLDQPAFPFGGSGLVGSPRDYDRFLRMLAGYGRIEGKRVMSEAAVRMGTSDLLPSPVVTKGTSVAGYGFGAGGRVGWAGGTSAFGWAGAAGTVGFVDMASGLRGGIYTQYMPSTAYPVYAEFEKAVESDLASRKGTA